MTTANVEVGGELTVSGNVAVDTNTLFVDTINSRVGIGTTSPLSELDIYKATEGTELIVGGNAPAFPSIRLWSTDGNNYNNHAVGTPVGTINFSGNERLTGDTHTGDSREFSYANTLYDWARISAIFVGSSSTSTSQGYVRGDLAFYTNNGNGATSDLQERMRIRHDGNVGIGVTTPHAKLHVNGASGSVSTTAGDITRYVYYNNTGLNGGSGWVNDFGTVSIYASDDIVSSGSLVSTTRSVYASDERIKRDIVDVQDDEALRLLRSIEPKKYKYKDTFKNGDEEVYGFIAQQISNVFPEATQVRTSYIPNIYETANVASKTITFPTFNTADLESNTFTLRVMDGENNEHDITITEVLDEHSVLVEEDLSELCGYVDENGDLVEQDKLFVFGQRVDDFIYLKKDSIWTVATSALQEVDRQLTAEKARNDALEARILALENA